MKSVFNLNSIGKILLVVLMANGSVAGQRLAERFFNVKLMYSRPEIQTQSGRYHIAYNGVSGTFSNHYDIPASYTSNLYQISVGFGKYKGLNHMICFDLLRGDIEKGQFGYFMGYNFAIEGRGHDVLFRPNFGLLAGNTNIVFEEIFSKDGLVFVYGDEIKAESAYVIQKFNSWSLRPSLEITYLFKQLIGINVEVGYNFALEGDNGNYKVQFADFSDANKDKEFQFTDENFAVIYPNGGLSKEKLYTLSGFYWSVGVSIYKSFDYD